jgi:hypothetical protein
MSPKRHATEDDLDRDALREEVRQWFALKQQANLLAPRLDKGTKRFKELLQKYGEKDPADGSLYLDLGEPVGSLGIRFLKNLCVTSNNVINDEAAEEILSGKGMWEEMTEIIRVPDQARINAAYYDNRITEAELKQMFPQVTSYRFFVLDEERKPVRS